MPEAARGRQVFWILACSVVESTGANTWDFSVHSATRKSTSVNVTLRRSGLHSSREVHDNFFRMTICMDHNWKLPNHPKMGEWNNKLQCIQTTIKMKKSHNHAQIVMVSLRNKKGVLEDCAYILLSCCFYKEWHCFYKVRSQAILSICSDICMPM